MCPRDEPEGTFYAPDFVTGVHRNILEMVLGGFGCDDSKPVTRNYLLCSSHELGPLLPEVAARTLGALASAPVKRFTSGRFEREALITPDEMRVVIERDIGFDRIDERINSHLAGN
jgi:hypothetical protein